MTLQHAAVPWIDTARAHLGVKEVPGKKANPKIVEFYAASGHPDVTDDDTPWCAAFVGYCLADSGLPTTQSLLARSYAAYGVDSRNDPQPGDVIVVPRGASWQGHVMLIEEVQSGLRRYKCIGGNQANQVSEALVGFDANIVAIRRPVWATAKDLKAAGSGAVARGEALKNVGDALTVGAPVVTVGAKVAEKLTEVPVPAPSAVETMQKATEQLDMFNKLTEAAISTGVFIANHPWIVFVMAVGVVVRVMGAETIKKRVVSFAAGVPLSKPKPA